MIYLVPATGALFFCVPALAGSGYVGPPPPPPRCLMCRVPTDAFVFIDVWWEGRWFLVAGAAAGKCCLSRNVTLYPHLPPPLFFETFLNGLFMHLFDYVFIYILMRPVRATQQQGRRLGGLFQILELLTR